MISFKGERIFTPGDRVSNDALLQKLRSAAAGRSLCLTNTGESDLLRGLSTLVGIVKKQVKGQIFPDDMVKYIASFLVLAHQKQDLERLFSSDVMKNVMARKSTNNNQMPQISSTEDLSGEGLSHLNPLALKSRFLEIFSHTSKIIMKAEDVIEILKQAEAKEALKFLPPNMIIKLMTNDTDLLKDALVKLEEAVANEVLSLKVEKAYLRPNNALLFNMEAPKEDAIDLRARAAG